MRATAAIALEVVFYVLAFGVRSWVQWRRTGSSGFVRPRRDAPLVERLGALAFVAALVLLVAAPVVDLTGGSRVEALDAASVGIVGAVIVCGGIGLCLAAQAAMGDSWRIGVDSDARTTLVTIGVFSWVRNPIFSAMVVAAAGLALMIPNVWALAALVVLVVGLELQVRGVEEPYLEEAHGVEYRGYAERAGRFFPGVGQLGPAR